MLKLKFSRAGSLIFGNFFLKQLSHFWRLIFPATLFELQLKMSTSYTRILEKKYDVKYKILNLHKTTYSTF
jgi:hypothetical protein